MSKNVIALTGDYGYINQISTTIKSILYHLDDCKIYVVNTDIPKEWFYIVNGKINSSGSVVIDKKISNETLNREHVGLAHIKPIAYGKIILSDLVDDPRVLYLDSDVVVNDDISPLFDLNMDGHPIAAVNDLTIKQFNTGVILYDMEKIHGIQYLVADELKMGQDQNLRNADQDVMNEYFKNDYYQLPVKYNYQIGMDAFAYYGNYTPYFEAMNKVDRPAIIHYLTADKPWKMLSSSRLREKWWQYYGLTLKEAVNHKKLPQVVPHFATRFLTFIRTDNYGKALESLIQALPNCQFNIAAWTNVSNKVSRLLKYDNVQIYPQIVGQQLDELTNNCDAYLAVNDGGNESKAITPFKKREAPIYTFVDEGHTDYDNYHVFTRDNLNGMVAEIKQVFHQQ